MTESDKDGTAEERLEEIKREEKEDASAYYAHGDTKEDDHIATNYNKPLEPVDSSKEEMSFLKTVAFLGFGLATLAIIFILFFIRDLDERVVNTDMKVDSTASTVAKLDGEIEPFKREVNSEIQKINADVNKLQSKIVDYERMMAVMELKRAMVTIQEVMGDSNQAVKSKTGMVVNSIQSLLGELDVGFPASSAVAAISKEPEPDATKELVVEEALAEETTEDSNEEAAAEEDKNGKEGGGESGDGVDEEHTDNKTSTSTALAGEESVGEIQLSEEDEELPPIDDLLAD